MLIINLNFDGGSRSYMVIELWNIAGLPDFASVVSCFMNFLSALPFFFEFFHEVGDIVTFPSNVHWYFTKIIII